jgi:hypothetical protein
MSDMLDRRSVAGSRLRTRAREGDNYGVALALILATILALAMAGDQALAQLVAVALGGGTLLFVLHTSHATRTTLALAGGVVGVALVVTGAALVAGEDPRSSYLISAVGLLLALLAPAAILRRVASFPTITVRAVLGALCIYLLVGLFFSYVFTFVGSVEDQPFFVQVTDPSRADFLYFSYTTQTTVGYGDLSARTDLGRMLAVSEALIGQIYLVSAVAFLVANIGRTRARGHEGPTDGPTDGPTG